jgi:2,4-dienoyl-CoA reductase-like NADH-dependent reductase (Old Yellow Enzyme family)/thioredoxin reductase
MTGLDRRSFVLAGSMAAAPPAVAQRAPRADSVAAASLMFPTLFTPIQLGGMHLKNRIVHAAMSTRFPDAGKATEPFITYHASRARGGAAMIVSEPVGGIARQSGGRRVDTYGDTAGDSLKRWAEAVERHDCRLVGQLQDSGRGRNEPGRNMDAIGASALPDDLSWTMPHALTTGEVAGLVEQFARSARNMQRAGLSGIEISAGHGHLFHQFMSAQANRREDRYGGDLEGRTRLLTETLSAIRSACGARFIVGVKLPGEDGVSGGIDLAQAAEITRLAHATGALSYVTYCWGAHADSLYLHLPDNHGPAAPYVQKIGDLAKSAPGVAVGALGLITRPAQAEEILKAGTADLVMLGRPLVTDPAWPKKASEGRVEQIRHCVSCNTCWSVINTGTAIRCDNNPRLATADEADWWPKRAAKAKRVVVVGAGIAGMEAAWTAAARGHEVTVLGLSNAVGGKARLHASLPGGRGLANITDFQRHNAERFGARLVLGAAATVESILALRPDSVILAAGATPRRPDFLKFAADGVQDLRATAAEVLATRGRRRPGTAVIYDQDHTAITYAVAELFDEVFDRVVVVTPRDRIATDEPVVNRQGIYSRLGKKRIEIVTVSEPLPGSAIARGTVNVANVFNGDVRAIDEVALFTYATSRVPNDALEAPLKARGIAAVLVGDCYAGRNVLTAVAEGHKAGMEV